MPGGDTFHPSRHRINAPHRQACKAATEQGSQPLAGRLLSKSCTKIAMPCSLHLLQQHLSPICNGEKILHISKESMSPAGTRGTKESEMGAEEDDYGQAEN